MNFFSVEITINRQAKNTPTRTHSTVTHTHTDMLYLNDNGDDHDDSDWLRIAAAMSTRPKRRNQPKIEKIPLHKLNSNRSILNSSSSSSFSSTSSSSSSSFSVNYHMSEAKNQRTKCLIYNKSVNKSRNFFNSSSDTLSKLALKKQKLKFNKLIDEFNNKSSKSKSDKRIRSKSNREARLLKRTTFSSLDNSSQEFKNGLKDTLLKTSKYKINK